ncbi:TetR family transcriptional regulator [Arthrobacter sp. zg-Y20]|uniref:TetR family transcriptional regulator n=1 Tax=unclassified Arthrobacter TaxID=235627 RepID=UPI001D145789|nr:MULTISPECIES: TetR family transcriptional regulator [unclassified Arthrobacter]MCC3276284.1 TetR family transcriptional regulator [Arthrobacter sp. zg-Y20]MDK1316443.1 TetR family transcriptional regulator [Arthrobacter sp. zg.Y20]WIB06488.1 TetR family transcriptional regulator [Arthrobacter sp. zg-Y20]
MRSDGEATRARVMAAARKEFAQYGLAGARVDRIAGEARASKERIYAYFGSKNALFTAVLAGNLQETTASIPRDAQDLPGFVGAMFDHAAESPEHLRILDWARLEGAQDLLPQASFGRPGPTDQDVARAQAEGLIDPAWDPHELMTLLFGLATSWAHSPERLFTGEAAADHSSRARRREAAVAAACRLLAPAAGS